MARVAFVGAGRMGLPMAQRLLTAGHRVTVTNRTARRTAALVEAGATAAATPREAARGAHAVLVMVSDDPASRTVWTGDDGVLAGADPGAFAIECSTLSLGWVLDLAAEAAARGLRYLDCPVTGLPSAAAAGELTVLAGGAERDVRDAEPFWRPLAADLVHFGPVGAGTAYKLIVNLMGAVQLASLAEALALAERAGLDPDQVARTIATGQAASPQVIRNSRRMVAGPAEGDVVFPARLRRKDTAYAIELADRLRVAAPLGRSALLVLDRLVADGLGEQNESAVIEVARRADPPH